MNKDLKDLIKQIDDFNLQAFREGTVSERDVIVCSPLEEGIVPEGSLAGNCSECSISIIFRKYVNKGRKVCPDCCMELVKKMEQNEDT